MTDQRSTNQGSYRISEDKFKNIQEHFFKGKSVIFRNISRSAIKYFSNLMSMYVHNTCMHVCMHVYML